MAVKDGVSYYPTERLISRKSRKHYRVPVRSQHWQLRSLISAEKQGTVYFPGGNGSNHIQRLTTDSRECETIKLLSFSPRCLVGKNGWVCCGGETGEFTAIHVNDPNPDDPNSSNSSNDLDVRLDLDPDSRLPLDFGFFNTDDSASTTRRTSRSNSRLDKNLVAKSMKLARDRVNCVTLWFPTTSSATPPVPGVYIEPVAVLANNDKSVVLVSLTDFEAKEKTDPLDVVTYPDYVNRAIVSPDGQLLIAILDDPFLYVHRRVEKRVDHQGSLGSRDDVQYQWEQCNRVLLKSQRRGDLSDSRGSFAACFSESGSYLAVGTQYGTISVFETHNLTDPLADPLLTTFTSSRPLAGSGAVRDMAFCPGPYDLLAWTEDRGRVGLADVRSGFAQQQTLDICAEDGFEHISILDRNTIDPRLERGSGDLHSSSLSSVLNLLDARRRRNLGPAERSAGGLSNDETLVLEALQVERRRREQTDRIATRLADHSSSSGLPTLGTLPWETSSGSASARSGAAWNDDTGLGTATGSRGSRERSSSVARALRELERDREERGNITRALSEWLRDSHNRGGSPQDRQRPPRGGPLGDRQQQQRDSPQFPPMPPRRTTTIRPGEGASRGTGGLRSTATATGTSSTLGSSGGWADLEALYNISLEGNLLRLGAGGSGTGDADESESTTQRDRDAERDREREGERERDRSGFLPFINSVSIREMDDRLARRRAVDHGGLHESPPEPDNTAGISWSEDGRILFVGAENGIYEFRVDTQARKYCPNLTLR